MAQLISMFLASTNLFFALREVQTHRIANHARANESFIRRQFTDKTVHQSTSQAISVDQQPRSCYATTTCYHYVIIALLSEQFQPIADVVIPESKHTSGT